MSLLYPLMLAGLAALSLPVLIHLIAKQRYPVHDFPSIRLLHFERRANVFARKLVDRWQLLLRLLVLLFLVLAMARFFSPSLSSAPAPRNLLVIIDASASMRLEATGNDGQKAQLIDLAKAQAKTLLGEISAPSHCLLAIAGDRLEIIGDFGADAGPALAALPDVHAVDGAGVGLVRAVAECCDMLRGRHEYRSQIIVLTDLRASAFEAADQRDLKRIAAARNELGDQLDLRFIDLAPTGATANIAILDTVLRGGEVRVGDDAHILAHLVNTGTEPAKPALRLSIGGKQEQPRGIELAAGAEAVVDLTVPVNRSERGFAEVTVQADDALPDDNHRITPFVVADACRVLLVRGEDRGNSPGSDKLAAMGSAPATNSAQESAPAVDGAAILRFALNPGRELGTAQSTGIEVQDCGVDALATQPLSKYDLIVLYDVSGVPPKTLEDLDTFVRQGKALLIIPSSNSNPAAFNKSFGSAIPGSESHQALSPAQLGNDKEWKNPIGLDLSDLHHEVMQPFRDRLQGDVSVLRFVKLRELLSLAPGAEIMFRGSDNTPLAVETKIGQGHSALLTFSLELDRGNIARSRAFPALLWRLVDHLTGRLRQRPSDILISGRSAVLDAAEPAFALATELSLSPQKPTPDAKSRTMPLSSDRSVLVNEQSQPVVAGAWMLHKPLAPGETMLGYARPVAVVGDPRESSMAQISPPELSKNFPGAQIVPLAKTGDLVPRGGELWAVLLMLLALLYAAEALIGHITTIRRERMHAEGKAP